MTSDLIPPEAQQQGRTKNNAEMCDLRDAARIPLQRAVDILGEAVTAETFAVSSLLVLRLRRALTHLLNARDELS